MIKLEDNVPQGMKLADNEKIIKAVENRLNNFTDGFCPCVPDSIGKEEYKCPCVKARVKNICCCGVFQRIQ